MKPKQRRILWPNHSDSQLHELIQRFEAQAEVLALEHLLELSNKQPNLSKLEGLRIAIESLYVEIHAMERVLGE